MTSQWGSAATGALSGAATGAALGSAVPVIGTGIGALGGGLVGGLSGYFGSQPDKFGEISTKTPGQQQTLEDILNQLRGGGTGQNYQAAQDYLGQLLSRDPSVYDKFAAPYMQNFEQQTIPRLAERFAGLGGGLGGGALSSSGFGQAVGGAGAQLQSQLANLFANLQQNAAGQSMNQYNQLANLGIGTQTFEPSYQPGTTGFAGGAGSGLGEAIGQYGGKGLMDMISSYLNDKSGKRTGIDNSQLAQGPAGIYPTQGNYNPYTG